MYIYFLYLPISASGCKTEFYCFGDQKVLSEEGDYCYPHQKLWILSVTDKAVVKVNPDHLLCCVIRYPYTGMFQRESPALVWLYWSFHLFQRRLTTFCLHLPGAGILGLSHYTILGCAVLKNKPKASCILSKHSANWAASSALGNGFKAIIVKWSHIVGL